MTITLPDGADTMKTLKDMLAQILNGTLLPPDIIRELDHNEIVEARHRGDFGRRWMQRHREINSRWPSADIAPEIAALAEDIRRESFLTVSRATHQHPIASYVSDDFDLIVRGSILSMEDQLLDELWNAYQRHEIPIPAAS